MKKKRNRKVFYNPTILLFLILIIGSCTGNDINTGHNGSPEQTAGSGTQDHPEPAYTTPPFTQKEIADPVNLPVEVFAKYEAYARPGPVIPGLFQDAVPQGIAYIPDEELLLISNYMFDGRTGSVAVIALEDNEADGRLEKVVWFHDNDGSQHGGHMGGIAVSGAWLWIASSSSFYQVPLTAVLEAENNEILLLGDPLTTEVTCSAAAADSGILYISEFRSRDGSYRTKRSHYLETASGGKNHALAAGFYLDESTGDIPSAGIIDGTAYPDFFLSIPDQVQGMAFIDGYIVLSQSYGRRNNSTLSVYRSPMGNTQDAEFTLSNGTTVPVWRLDSSNLISVLTAPPMTEGIVNIGGELALLYESGSDKYRDTAGFPQSRVHIISAEILNSSR